MKQFFSTVAAIVLLSAISLAQAPAANDILKEAYVKAAKENKNVIVIFHASWCGWCHKMDNSMNDASTKKYFDDNYVIAHLVVDESKGKENLENPGANQIRTKYNGDGIGIPFWLVFDKNGNLLADSKIRTEGQGPEAGENIGCPANEKEVSYFVGILKKTSKINDQQAEAVRKRFRMNE
jgi:thiol-disulfide isomerase/thioredoxin